MPDFGQFWDTCVLGHEDSTDEHAQPSPSWCEFITNIYLEPNGISGRELAEKLGKRSINPVRQDGVCFQEAGAEAVEQFHGSSAS